MWKAAQKMPRMNRIEIIKMNVEPVIPPANGNVGNLSANRKPIESKINNNAPCMTTPDSVFFAPGYFLKPKTSKMKARKNMTMKNVVMPPMFTFKNSSNKEF